jgi:hypothetical protein
MKTIVGYIKSTIVGGFFILLPLLLLCAVLSQAFAIALKIAAPIAASTGRIRSASRRPLSVRGMSVVPVCCPLRLHAVSPCLITKTFTFASSKVKRCPPLWNAPLTKLLPAPTASL